MQGHVHCQTTDLFVCNNGEGELALGSTMSDLLVGVFPVKIDRLNCVCGLKTGWLMFCIEFSVTGSDSEPSFFSEPKPSPKFLEPPKLTSDPSQWRHGPGEFYVADDVF